MYVYIWIYGVESVPCGLTSAGWRCRLPEFGVGGVVLGVHVPSGRLGVTNTRAFPAPYIRKWWWSRLENRDVRPMQYGVIYGVRIDKRICADHTSNTTSVCTVSRVISILRKNRPSRRNYHIAMYEPDTTIPPLPSGRDFDTPIPQYTVE